jgi:hypothetical protein
MPWLRGDARQGVGSGLLASFLASLAGVGLHLGDPAAQRPRLVAQELDHAVLGLVGVGLHADLHADLDLLVRGRLGTLQVASGPLELAHGVLDRPNRDRHLQRAVVLERPPHRVRVLRLRLRLARRPARLALDRPGCNPKPGRNRVERACVCHNNTSPPFNVCYISG